MGTRDGASPDLAAAIYAVQGGAATSSRSNGYPYRAEPDRGRREGSEARDQGRVQGLGFAPRDHGHAGRESGETNGYHSPPPQAEVLRSMDRPGMGHGAVGAGSTGYSPDVVWPGRIGQGGCLPFRRTKQVGAWFSTLTIAVCVLILIGQAAILSHP
jgi:hypothetical protein